MTTAPSSMRTGISRVSRPLLVRLHSFPRPVFVLILVGLVAAAAFAPTVAAVPAAVLVLVASAWLTYLSWPVLSNGGRVVRLVVLACLVLVMTGRYFG